MKQEFRSTKLLGLVTGILLISGVVLDGFTLLLDLIERRYFYGIWRDTGEEFQDSETVFVLVYLLVVVLGLVVFIGTIGFFLAWIKRSYQNLAAFNVQSLSSTPGWAVGYWFIPFGCFYYPLKIVNEIYHGSDPALIKGSTRFADNSTPAMHGFWWALWVISSIGSNISFRIAMTAESAEMIEAVEIADLVMIPLWMVCGWLAYRVVKEITRRQEIVGSERSVNEPPAPPTFGEFQNGDF